MLASFLTCRGRCAGWIGSGRGIEDRSMYWILLYSTEYLYTSLLKGTGAGCDMSVLHKLTAPHESEFVANRINRPFMWTMIA